MTKDEALAFDLALEALEVNNQAWKSLADSGDAGFWEAEEQPFYELSVKAITAIKQARSAPVQEPVAWRDAIAVNLLREGINKHRARELADHFISLITPPTAQRQWVEVEQIKWEGDKLIAKLKENA